MRVREDAPAIAKAKGYESLVEISTKMAGRIGQHCEHVSSGCVNCYADANNHRCLPGNGTGLPYDRRSRDLVEAFVDERVLLEPLKWRPVKIENPTGGYGEPIFTERPRRIFVENQSDLFGEWVTDDMIDRIFALMAVTGGCIFQVLTKRPGRMLTYCAEAQLQVWDALTRIPPPASQSRRGETARMAAPECVARRERRE